MAASGRPTQAAREQTKGLFFFSESDIKNNAVLKQDATGKNILAVLRHCGRLKEFKHMGLRCWRVATA